MFAYIENNVHIPAKGERRRAPCFISQDFVYNRRPVYKVNLRNGRMDHKIREEIMRRFKDRVLFPENMIRQGMPESYHQDYEQYKKEVYIKSVRDLLRKKVFDIGPGDLVCIADGTGECGKLLEEASAQFPKLCILTVEENKNKYMLQADHLLRERSCAVPVFTSPAAVGESALVFACGGAELPRAENIIARDRGIHDYAIVPASALPETVTCPSGIDPMAFSFAVHRFCAGEILPADGYYGNGRYKIPYNIRKEKIHFLVK